MQIGSHGVTVHKSRPSKVRAGSLARAAQTAPAGKAPSADPCPRSRKADKSPKWDRQEARRPRTEVVIWPTTRLPAAPRTTTTGISTKPDNDRKRELPKMVLTWPTATANRTSHLGQPQRWPIN